MKKLLLLAALLTTAAFTACNDNKADDGQQAAIDSLSYELGMMQSAPMQQLADYLQQAGADSAAVDELIKGMQDGLKGADNQKKLAYLIGTQIGVQSAIQMKQMEASIMPDSLTHLNKSQFMKGFLATAKGTPYVVDGDTLTAMQVQQRMQARIQKLTAASNEAKYGDLKGKNQKFMAEVAKKAGVKKCAGGNVYYKVVKAGTGEKPTAADQVEVAYEGRLIDGTVFDSSIQRGQNATFPVGQVIKGWQIALTEMPVGSEWEIYIPADLAYGEQGAGQNIPPYAALVFKVTLVKIVK